MASTASYLDQLELADSLREHVFTLVRAGDMNGALILIRADVHSAMLALTLAADTTAGVASVTPGGGETDEADESKEAESGELESGEAEKTDGQQQDPEDMDLAEKAPAQLSAVG